MAKRNDVKEPDVKLSAQEFLENNISLYADLKKSLNELKKRETEMNAAIKEAMAEIKKEEIEIAGYKVSCKTSYKESFIDEKVIALVKDKGISGVIVKKEVIDEAGLEQAIYSGKISKLELKDCQLREERVTLLVKEAK